MSAVTVHEIELGGDTTTFTLKRSARRSLGIAVEPDGSLHVTAPENASIDDILSGVRRKQSWIARQRHAFEELRPHTPDRQYRSGETYRYLGKQMRLRVIADGEMKAAFRDSTLTITGCERDDKDHIKTAVRAWYLDRAKEVFPIRLRQCMGMFAPEKIVEPSLSVRRMEKRWGSMSHDGNRLVLNTRLVEAAIDQIDYVIIHELCHAVHSHHGPDFYTFLGIKCPDYRARKRRLEKVLV